MPTEKDIQDYETMMQALINISGHCHMIEGWHDSLIIIKKYLALYDPFLLPKMMKVLGDLKMLNKQITKTFVKDDENSLTTMYDQIGKGISSMSKMTHENAQKYIDELEILSEKYK